VARASAGGFWSGTGLQKIHRLKSVLLACRGIHKRLQAAESWYKTSTVPRAHHNILVRAHSPAVIREASGANVA